MWQYVLHYVSRTLSPLSCCRPWEQRIGRPNFSRSVRSSTTSPKQQNKTTIYSDQHTEDYATDFFLGSVIPDCMCAKSPNESRGCHGRSQRSLVGIYTMIMYQTQLFTLWQMKTWNHSTTSINVDGWISVNGTPRVDYSSKVLGQRCSPESESTEIRVMSLIMNALPDLIQLTYCVLYRLSYYEYLASLNVRPGSLGPLTGSFPRQWARPFDEDNWVKRRFGMWKSTPNWGLFSTWWPLVKRMKVPRWFTLERTRSGCSPCCCTARLVLVKSRLIAILFYLQAILHTCYKMLNYLQVILFKWIFQQSPFTMAHCQSTQSSQQCM